MQIWASRDPSADLESATTIHSRKHRSRLRNTHPSHDAHRKVIQPVSSPRSLKKLEPLIRERAIQILVGLPVGESFDWVDRLSIELTTGMLATMFDFPWEDRRKLTYWSDMATASDQQLVEMGGQLIKRGHRVLMWYVSGNRDESVIELGMNS